MQRFWRGSMLLATCLALSTISASTHAQTTARPPLRVQELVEGGGRVAWSTQGNTLAFDQADTSRADGLYDIYLLADPLSGGANRRGRCLTCKAPDFRKVHAINPSFHPSGDQLVFQTVGLANKTGLNGRDLNGPGRSNRSELWIARTDGKDFFKLTDFYSIGAVALDPSFSFEGKRLVWSERYNSKKGTWGAWKLRSGVIRTKRGVPRLRSLTVEFAPEQPALLIPHGYTPNEQGFLISANLEDGQRAAALDIYVVSKGSTQRLTRTGGLAETAARFHPNNSTITFTSSQALRRAQTADDQPVKELWSMALDGSDQRRLTHFNEPPADEYRGATFVGDFEWHPDGQSLAAQIVSGRDGKASIVLITFDER